MCVCAVCGSLVPVVGWVVLLVGIPMSDGLLEERRDCFFVHLSLCGSVLIFWWEFAYGSCCMSGTMLKRLSRSSEEESR